MPIGFGLGGEERLILLVREHIHCVSDRDVKEVLYPIAELVLSLRLGACSTLVSFDITELLVQFFQPL